MATVVKHSYIRLRGAKNYGRLFAHINYIQWRPDDDRGTDDKVTQNYYNETKYTQQEKQFIEDQEQEKPTATVGEAVRELEDDEETRDPNKPWARLFYTEDRDGVTGTELKHIIGSDLEKGDVVHKLMLSPGDNNVDIVRYGREVMNELGRVKGQDLRYFFVIHENTDHYHAHMVVLGRDQEGQEVRFGRDDHARIKAFGDRILERDYGITREFDKQMEEWCRDHGVNIFYSKDVEQDLWKVINLPDEQLKARRDPLIDMLEWDKFNDDWRKFLEDKTGREGGRWLGKNKYEDLGRVSDFTQLGENKREIEKWEDIASNVPDLQEVAEERLLELIKGDDGLREMLDEKTKPYGDQFIERLAGQLTEEAQLEKKQLEELLGPMDKAVEQSQDRGRSLAEVTGMVGGPHGWDSPLLEDYDDKIQGNTVDRLLGFDQEPVLDIEREPEPARELESDLAQAPESRLDKLGSGPADPSVLELVVEHDPTIHESENAEDSASLADFLTNDDHNDSDLKGLDEDDNFLDLVDLASEDDGFDFSMIDDDTYDTVEEAKAEIDGHNGRDDDEYGNGTPSSMGGLG